MSESNPSLIRPPFFEPLAAHHDRAGFDYGEPALNDFLKRRARQNAERNLGVTYVAVADPGETAILGYYTLLIRSIERDAFSGTKKLPPGEIGVTLLARLAVSQNAQGRGLGTTDAVARHHANRTSGARVRHSCTHCSRPQRTRQSLVFEPRFWFELLTDNPLHLCLSIGKIRQLGLDN